ncbi:MAG TPA: methyl-accepting chemotaxis protein, partial [Candidatus Bathyarchaeia archaeon]|nr:methyl-accepting chemotaxis protein [Candidatus Bathyarchaeia archaeon]
RIEAARADHRNTTLTSVGEEARRLADASKSAARQVSKISDGIRTDAAAALKSLDKNSSLTEECIQTIESRLLPSLVRVQHATKQARLTVPNIERATAGDFDLGSKLLTAISEIAEIGDGVRSRTNEIETPIQQITTSLRDAAAGTERLKSIMQSMHTIVSRYRLDQRDRLTTSDTPGHREAVDLLPSFPRSTGRYSQVHDT